MKADVQIHWPNFRDTLEFTTKYCNAMHMRQAQLLGVNIRLDHSLVRCRHLYVVLQFLHPNVKLGDIYDGAWFNLCAISGK
jgi:hypothetical protein